MYLIATNTGQKGNDLRYGAKIETGSQHGEQPEKDAAGTKNITGKAVCRASTLRLRYWQDDL